MAEIAVVCENKIVGWLPRPETRVDVAVFVLCEPTRSAKITAEELYYPLAVMSAAIDPRLATCCTATDHRSRIFNLNREGSLAAA